MILHGDSREILTLFPGTADLIVTSPPYADARKKHYDSVAPDGYVEWFLTFSDVFAQTLKPSGSLIINIKDKIVNGVRHRYVWDTIQALTDRGWFCIDDYIWHKPNCMPGFWPTRLRDGWEYCFHLSRTKRPYFNSDAVRVPIGAWAKPRLSKDKSLRHSSTTQSGFGRNMSNWVGKDSVLPSNVLYEAVVGRNQGHPAVFPVSIPEFFIKLLSPENGLVIDPFAGSGTTGIAATKNNRKFILIDNHKGYCEVAKKRLES